MTHDEFVSVVKEAIDALPEEFRGPLLEIDILVEDEPTARELKETGTPEDETLFGIFRGESEMDRSVWNSGMLPGQVVLFRIPLVEAFPDRAELIREIQLTLFHEVGHFFGMEEDDLDRLGMG